MKKKTRRRARVHTRKLFLVHMPPLCPEYHEARVQQGYDLWSVLQENLSPLVHIDVYYVDLGNNRRFLCIPREVVPGIVWATGENFGGLIHQAMRNELMAIYMLHGESLHALNKTTTMLAWLQHASDEKILKTVYGSIGGSIGRCDDVLDFWVPLIELQS